MLLSTLVLARLFRQGLGALPGLGPVTLHLPAADSGKGDIFGHHRLGIGRRGLSYANAALM